MRALLAVLLALFHVSGVSWAGETILSGDSDHTYLPTNHEQEVLLQQFSWRASVSSPATYSAWAATFNANCHQQYDYQGSDSIDGRMSNSGRECTKPENAFRAPRKFRLTRVMIRVSKDGTYSNPSTAGWAQSNIRVVTVSTSGTITEVGAETAYVTGVGTLISWDLAVDVPVGTGVALQARSLAGIAADDIGTGPIVQFWGIWE